MVLFKEAVGSFQVSCLIGHIGLCGGAGGCPEVVAAQGEPGSPRKSFKYHLGVDVTLKLPTVFIPTRVTCDGGFLRHSEYKLQFFLASHKRET